MNNDNQPSSTTNQKFNLTLDLRWIIGLLLVVIAGMLMLWQPWDSTVSNRTISVTGEATVSAEPDEYSFSPSYRFENSEQQAALDSLREKSEQITTDLKDLGVADSQIKNNSSGNDRYYYPTPSPSTETVSYTLQLTITLDDKELAQKVQDYLLTTGPTGSITPYVTFSDSKRDELESQARDEATQDARAKADQSANNLGFKLGDVKQVSDGTGFGYYPLTDDIALNESVSSSSGLSLQPGENDLNYSVTVVYYVK